jgi:hypothetical protein
MSRAVVPHRIAERLQRTSPPGLGVRDGSYELGPAAKRVRLGSTRECGTTKYPLAIARCENRAFFVPANVAEQPASWNMPLDRPESSAPC